MTKTTEKKGFCVVAESGDVYVYGGIGAPDSNGRAVDTDELLSELSAISSTEINVRIASQGGVVDEAFRLYNAFVSHPAKVTMTVDGVAHSAASMLLQAGDERRAQQLSEIMIHAPRGGGPNLTEAQHESAAKALKSYKSQMIVAYGRHGVSEQDIEGWMNGDDHYFSSSEALAAGLIDAVDDMPVATSAPDDYRVAASSSNNSESIHQHTESPLMAKDDSTPATKPAVETKPTNQDTGAFLASHAQAVTAGVEKGAKAENERQQKVSALFHTDAGAFAYGDATDATDPMVALMTQCLSDVNCSEDEALRRINAAQRSGLRPLANPIESAQPYTGTAYARSRQAPAFQHLGGFGDATVSGDAGDRFIEGATLALSVRSGLEKDAEKVKQARSNEFLSMTIADLCKEQLRITGQNVGGSREDVIRRVIAAGPGQGSDHFANILENIANKAIMDRFAGAEETWGDWVVQGSLNDYREASRINKSLFDKLDLMIEHAPFEHGRFADVKQAITGYLYGKEFSLTLQAMTNDDTGLLTDDMGAWGEAASVTIGDAVFTALTASGTGGYGQTMTEDSQILFHADHSNYIATGSGGAPASATIQAARTAMMTQTDPNSRIVASRPRYILHGTTLTPTVWILLNSMQNITGADGTLPDRNWVQSQGLQSVEDYRFDSFVSTAWILAAARRTVEVAFVQGQSTPRVDRMQTSSIPGMSWQISIPFGVSALDYRTLYFNHGA